MLSSQVFSEICKETIGPLIGISKLKYYRNWNRNPYGPGISKYLSSPNLCKFCLYPREEEWQYGLKLCKFCDEAYSSVDRGQICEDCFEANVTDILVNKDGRAGALRSPLARPYLSWSSVANYAPYAGFRRASAPNLSANGVILPCLRSTAKD